MKTVVALLAILLLAVTPALAGSVKDVDPLDEKVTGQDKKEENQQKNEAKKEEKEKEKDSSTLETLLTNKPTDGSIIIVKDLPPVDATVPEPSTLAFLGMSLAGGVGLLLRRRP
jgi:hypothetical protein